MQSCNNTFTEEFNKVLNDPSSNLETILDQETVVDELKHRNEALIKYLTQDDIISKLISYIVEFPKSLDYDPNQSNRDQLINKFPLVVSDLLSTENEEIICKILGIADSEEADEMLENFLNDDDPSGEGNSASQYQANSEPSKSKIRPIYKLLKFLDSDSPINFTLANYFSKVTKNLLFKSPVATSLYIFKIYFDFFKKITSHVYCDSIQELLSSIIKLEPSYFRGHKKCQFTEQRLKLVTLLVDNIYDPKSKMDENYLLDNQVSSANLVGHLIVQNTIVVDGRKILNYLISKETLDKIFTGVSNERQVGSSCYLIIQLCDYFTVAYAPKSNKPILDLTNFVNVNLPPEFDDNDPFLIRVINSISKITSILDYNPRHSSKSNWPSSTTRMKLLEVVYSYIKLQNKNLDKQISESSLLSALLEIIGYDYWSNILHHLVTKILIYIINECSEAIKKALFEKAKVLDFIVDAVKELNTLPTASSKTSVEKGNVAHLILLANAINNSENPYVVQQATSNSSWTGFVQSLLHEKNIKYTAKIGGDPDHTKRFKIKMKVDEEDMPADKSAEKALEEAKAAERNLLRRSSKSFEEILIEEVNVDKDNDSAPGPKKGLGNAMLSFGAVQNNSDDDDDDDSDGSPKTPHKNQGNVGFESF